MAAVVITIHTLGQVGLHFQVSVPQILSAVLTAAIVGVAVTFRATRTLVWPASAMLTGSGVALILRVPTTTPGDHWTTHKWYVFAGVSVFCLPTKHVIGIARALCSIRRTSVSSSRSSCSAALAWNPSTSGRHPSTGG